MHFGIATPSVFLVCVCGGWAGLGDVVQYLVSDESAEGFSSSYYIHNGFKLILKMFSMRIFIFNHSLNIS